MGSIPVKFIDLLLNGNFINYATPAKKAILKVYHRDLVDKDLTIPYDRIAEYVYKNENSDEDNENLNLKVNFIISEFKGSPEEKVILIKNLNKITNNYTLSQIQKKFIEDSTIQTNTLLKDLDVKANSIKVDLKNTRKIANDISKTKASIYTDFIAILGVFSAFIFVMFGGIEIARAVFDIGDDLTKLDLSRVITISCVMLIGVLILMYSLLLWIARITDKKLGVCYDTECTNGCIHPYKHLLGRHPFFFSIVAFLVVIIFISHHFY